jgi:hypothetical protein
VGFETLNYASLIENELAIHSFCLYGSNGGKSWRLNGTDAKNEPGRKGRQILYTDTPEFIRFLKEAGEIADSGGIVRLLRGALRSMAGYRGDERTRKRTRALKETMQKLKVQLKNAPYPIEKPGRKS